MWIIVHFLLEQGLAVVPLCWYSNGECRWPDRKEREPIKSLVERKANPKDSWLTYKARTLGNTFYDNLLIARNKCALAENTSDLNSEPERGKGKRKVCHIEWSSESEEENRSCADVAEGFPMPPTLKTTESVKVGEKSGSSPADALREDGKNSRFEAEVLRTLMFIKHTLVDVSKRLSALEAPVSGGDAAAGEVGTSLLGSYPIVTLLQLEEEEKKLQDKSYRKQLVSEFRIIGGNSAKDLTRRILRAMITDVVAAEYSWQGFKKKKVFCKLLLKDVLFDAVRQSRWGSTTDKEVETYIKDWLRHAKFRIGGSINISEKENVNYHD